MEGKTPGDGKTSPFGDGNGATQAAGASTGHAPDFTKSATSGTATGKQMDVSSMNRPQTEAKKEVTPCPEEIPKAGGVIYKADPVPGMASAVGASTGVAGAMPFKNMK